MSTGTIRDAVRWCLGCCRSRATGRWTNCGGAGDGGGRRTVWGRRRGRKSSSRTRRRTKQPCPGARCARVAARRAAARGDAGVFRGPVAQSDRAPPAAAAGDGENAAAGRSSEADRSAGTFKGLAAMTDWLGMSVPPRTPRPELKGRVLARAVARGRRWPLALAAALVVVTAGVGSAWWAYRTIEALGADRDRLAAHVAALEDTVSSFIHDPATRR